MSDKYTGYESPFQTRYASREMQVLFSAEKKFKTWRRLWVSLAKAERELGLPITAEQIAELEAFRDKINYDVAEAREKECRHDVMSHIYAYGVQCPKAAGIIHLGATSCYVCDNTDILVMREALGLVTRKVLSVMSLLAGFAMKYRDMPALAYTHLQPAQLTTVGKRAALWLSELEMDYRELEYRTGTLKLLGSKGTTGTQASFLELFNGDAEKVTKLESLIAGDLGFGETVPVSGQTYSRKVDFNVLSALSGLAQSASKFSNDLRLLQSFKEMEEPFEKSQVGSSAMPYKRNPMRSERITSLARYVIADLMNPAFTSASQWFERTLDDSANKRVAVAEAFLAADAILNIMLNVCDGLVVYPKVIYQRVMRELPFMATENIMMKAVKKGGDRQELHGRIRVHSIEAAKNVKENGLENDLMERIAKDAAFNLGAGELKDMLDPGLYTGLAARQVERYITDIINPILEQHAGMLGEKAELSV